MPNNWKTRLINQINESRKMLDKAIDELQKDDFEGCSVLENIELSRLKAQLAIAIYEEE